MYLNALAHEAPSDASSTDQILVIQADCRGDIALADLLDGELAGGSVVVKVKDCAAAVAFVEHKRVSCAVYGATVGDDRAFADVAFLRAACPDLALVVVTDTDDDARALAMIEAGVGYVLVKARIGGTALAHGVRAAILRQHTSTSASEAQRIARVGSWEVEVATGLVSWSRELFSVLGIDLAVVPTWQTLIDRTHPDDREAALAAIRGTVVTGDPFGFDHRLLLPDGEVRWVRSRGRLERDPRSEPGRLLGAIQDITEQVVAETALEHQAFHDNLTGLPNRALFIDRLSQAIKRLSRQRGAVAVFTLGLDRFKIINDSLGRGHGDDLLKAVALRLAALLRPGDTLARFGGDEFAVLCESLTDLAEAVGVADRMQAAMAEPFGGEHADLVMSVSAGVAVATSSTADAELLVADSDAAMQRAKDDGRARTVVFAETMRTTAAGRLETEVSLRQAIAHGDLRIHYQPIVDISDGRVVGHEALVRWQHPTRGLLSPDAFIAIAEDTGLIVPLGAWVLREACRDAKRFQDRAPMWADLTMSVNLSGAQLGQPDLVEVLRSALDDAGLRPEHLQLEMTESVLMDDAANTITILESLKAVGVRLGVDDFGTGYSSLAYLKRFPVDVLKVDRSFVSRLGSDFEDSAIVAAVVSLADILGLVTIAEGVETTVQRDCLSDLGCRRAQGYLFARPHPASDVEEALGRAEIAAGVGDGEQASEAIDARSLVADDELMCDFQPFVNLRTGLVEGADTIVRRTHRHAGVAPVETVDSWTQDAAFGLAATAPLLHGLPISVNATIRALGDRDYAEHLLGALARHHLRPSSVFVVVPGSTSLIDDEVVRTNLATLRRAGALVHLDDYGSEYASLSSLEHMPVDVIRIDRSLVQGLPHDEYSDALVRAITVAARRASVSTIAEGVDNPAQMDALIALGVDHGQGRLYCKPCDVETLGRWIDSGVTASRRRAVERVGLNRRSVAVASMPTDHEAATTRLAATRSLLRVEVVEEAVGVCIALVRSLGGWTIPARLDDGSALPIDFSFGHGEPLLAMADSPLARLRLEQVLPDVLDDARDAIARIRRRDDLGREARTDPLTGLLNRRAIDQVLNRLQPEDAIVVIDLDRFKTVNDSWGHPAGDEVLIAFSRAVRDRSRAGDHFARVGGDELLAVLTDTNEAGLTVFLDRLNVTWHATRPRDVSYSAGAAWLGHGSVPDALAAADAALYEAKDRGRDQSVVVPRRAQMADMHV